MTMMAVLTGQAFLSSAKFYPSFSLFWAWVAFCVCEPSFWIWVSLLNPPQSQVEQNETDPWDSSRQ